MSKRINTIDLTSYLQHEGQIIEAVPPSERQNFMFWRGAHLGKIALNFLRGEMILNAGPDPYVAHFAYRYERAVIFAGELTNPESGRISQFTPADGTEFEALTKVRADFIHPAMVIGLKNDYAFDLELSEGFGGGWVHKGPLTLEHIDPHSAEAIQRIIHISQPDYSG